MAVRGPKTALVVIDVQRGLDDPKYGERSQPEAEHNIARLLAVWRQRGWPVVHVQHLSREPESPLRPGSPGVAIKEEVAPMPGEPLFQKSASCAFVGTELDQYLRAREVSTVVAVGLTIDHCVSSSARTASDLGYATIVVADATAAFELDGHDGRRWRADEVHGLSLAALRGEFATIVETDELIGRLQILDEAAE